MKFVLQVKLIVLGFLAFAPTMAKAELDVEIAFITQEIERPPVLSNLMQDPDDLGLQGAKLALRDSNTTGRFTKQTFHLETVTVEEDGDVLPVVLAQIEKGRRFFVLDLPGQALKNILKGVQNQDVLFFNTRSHNDDLRGALCDVRLLHTMASQSMLTDGLAQYLVKKRWAKWFLISGVNAEDRSFAASMERSARKYGAKLVEKKEWDGARDARRTAQAEVPLLTQGASYDVLVVADKRGDFGEYLMYRTFDPRPVVGTQGLFPTIWFWTQEQWGATQLQSRFLKQAGRFMQARDYSAWAAVRSIAEAAIRTQSNEFQKINEYIRSDAFELAAFKGRKLSFRKWDGQLRQPIALTSARSLVAQAPIEGFLHRYSELDTLGFDEPETKCRDFKR